MGICNWFEKPKNIYEVVVHLNGRHPYVRDNHLDYETRDITFRVTAKSWNDAEEKALDIGIRLECWSANVKSISRIKIVD